MRRICNGGEGEHSECAREMLDHVRGVPVPTTRTAEGCAQRVGSAEEVDWLPETGHSHPAAVVSGRLPIADLGLQDGADLASAVILV